MTQFIFTVFLGSFLFMSSAMAEKKTITLKREIVLRTIEGSMDKPFVKVKSLPTLPAGTVLKVDTTRYRDPHQYVDESGKVFTSNSGWLYGFLIESLPTGTEPQGQTLEEINNMKLFTLYNNLGLKKKVTGFGSVNDGPIVNLSGDFGKCVPKIRNRVGHTASAKAATYFRQFRKHFKGNYHMVVNYGFGRGDRAFIVDIRRCKVVASGPMSHGNNARSSRQNPKGQPVRYCGRKNETRPGVYKVSGLYWSSGKSWSSIRRGKNGIRLVGLTKWASKGARSGVVAHEASYGGHGRSNGCFSAPKGQWRRWYGKYINPGSMIYAHAPGCRF